MSEFGNYVPYNESLYRTGFRPYGLTNPRGATQLGAIPRVDHGWGGFGPWVLHGYPFSERGGEALHGLGGMVPDGSIITYSGKWMPHGMQGAKDVMAQVVAALEAQGLHVRNASTSSYRFLLDNTFDAKMQIQINTGKGGFGDPNDINAIIAGVVYDVTGSMPVGSIPSVQLPSSPGGPLQAPETTGQPAGPGTECFVYDPSNPNCTQSQSQSTDWGSWIQNNFGTIALAVGALAILPPLLKKVF